MNDTPMSVKEALQEAQEERRWDRVKLVAEIAGQLYASPAIQHEDVCHYIRIALDIVHKAEEACM